MPRFAFWRLGRALLLVAALAVGLANFAGAFSPLPTPTALASVAYQDNDNDEDDDNDNDDEEERTIEGTILAEGWLPNANPPEFLLGILDGPVRVVVIRPEAINESGARPCDYVSVDGEFIEADFIATDIEVEDRGCVLGENDND